MGRPLRDTRVDVFLKTGHGVCKKHGNHSDFRHILVKIKNKNGKKQPYTALDCRICNRERTREYNKKNPNYQDDYRFSYNGILSRIFNQASTRARIKSIPIDIDFEWVNKKMKEQDYKCYYSGLTFDFTRPKEREKFRPFIPSIDQKVAGMGYTKENCVLCCLCVNLMKNEWSIDQFFDICYKIAKKNIIEKI